MKKEKNVLKVVKKKIKVEIPLKYNLIEFFVNRKGLYVWNNFKDNVLKKANAVTKTEFDISSLNLTEDANNEKIENSLPKDHLFSETEVCAIIAGLIEKQPDGEEGTLLNNGYVNLFYTTSHVVLVRWNGVAWNVDGWRRVDDGWLSGYRVFSPATEI